MCGTPFTRTSVSAWFSGLHVNNILNFLYTLPNQSGFKRSETVGSDVEHSAAHTLTQYFLRLSQPEKVREQILEKVDQHDAKEKESQGFIPAPGVFPRPERYTTDTLTQSPSSCPQSDSDRIIKAAFERLSCVAF